MNTESEHQRPGEKIKPGEKEMERFETVVKGHSGDADIHGRAVLGTPESYQRNHNAGIDSRRAVKSAGLMSPFFIGLGLGAVFEGVVSFFLR